MRELWLPTWLLSLYPLRDARLVPAALPSHSIFWLMLLAERDMLGSNSAFGAVVPRLQTLGVGLASMSTCIG